MPFNGAGVFGRLFSWQTDKAGAVPVTASRMDSEMDGFATGLSTCILKDGTQTVTATIPWNSQGLTGVGTLTVTGSTASTTPTTGAAVITGGVGVGGAVNVGSTTASTSTTTGSIVAAGGAGIAGRVTADNFRASNQPCFSAHKNGTDQTGVTNGTFTKVTFTTEVFDIGGYYDAASSRWTPPVGMVNIHGSVSIENALPNNLAVLAIYKNGVRYKDSIVMQGALNGLTAEDNGFVGAVISIIDRANGTDYYELFVFGSTSDTFSVDGLASSSYFMASVI